MQGFIHNQKGSGVIGDIIEKYVAANETIEAGSFVEFVNGLAEGSILTTSPVNLQCNTSAGSDFEAELLSENKIIVAYCDYYSTTTRYLKVRILTIDKNQIILGDEYTLNDVETSYIRIKALNSNSAIIVYQRYNTESYMYYGYAIAISITDDGIITPSNIINFSTDVHTNAVEPMELCKVSSSAAFVAFRGSSYYCKAMILNYNSGTNNISFGSVSTIASVKAENIKAAYLQDDNIVLVYTDISAKSLIAKKITISGTSITTNFTNTLVTGPSDLSTYPSCDGIIALSTDRVLIKYVGYDNGSIFLYMACKLYNNNFVPGNILQSEYFGGNVLNTLVKIDENTVVTYGDDEYEILDIRDTHISLVGSGKLPDDTRYDGTQLQKVADGRIFLITDTSPNFVGRVLVVDENKLTTEIIEGTFEVQIRKATTSKADGVARTTGIGGSRTKHGGTIQVYVPKIEE